MKHPQVVVYERDGRLAQLLREPIQARRWALRQPRQREACLRLVLGGDPTVLVLKLSAKLEQELALLERTHGLTPEVCSVVVGDVENDALAELAWDLGASYVLFPPLPREWLPDLVVQLMNSTSAVQSTPDLNAHRDKPGGSPERGSPSPPIER
jgi:hypothetical protein